MCATLPYAGTHQVTDHCGSNSAKCVVSYKCCIRPYLKYLICNLIRYKERSPTAKGKLGNILLQQTHIQPEFLSQYAIMVQVAV